MNAVVRDGFLYTCQHVGLSGTNGTYVGNAYGTNTDNYFPSIAVNCAFDMLLGFSGSSSNTYIGAYYTWRPVSGMVADAPVLFHPGEGSYNNDRWGDYSASMIDPLESLSFWTIQQYAKEPDGPIPTWGTWIGKIKRQ